VVAILGEVLPSEMDKVHQARDGRLPWQEQMT
jgi:hypothetical protein